MTPLWFWSFTDPLDPLRMEQARGFERMKQLIMNGYPLEWRIDRTQYDWIERDIDEDRQGLYQ